jgi:hypothetical protein
MITLKSDQPPPNGFQYFQAETGWDSLTMSPSSQWDLGLLCREIQKMRQANPRFNLNTDLNAIKTEVKQVNAMRMLSIPGADYYITQDSAPSYVSPKQLRPLRKNASAGAVAGVNRLISGAGTILEMFGESGPDTKETAERRASVCVTCKFNDKGDWTRFFTEPAANVIRSRLGIVKDLDLTTSKDAELQTCTICACPLKLKIYARIQHILAHMPEKVRQDIAENAPWCWVNSESKA